MWSGGCLTEVFGCSTIGYTLFSCVYFGYSFYHAHKHIHIRIVEMGSEMGQGDPCRWRWALHPPSESSVLNLEKIARSHILTCKNTLRIVFIIIVFIIITITGFYHYINFPTWSNTWEEDEVKTCNLSDTSILQHQVSQSYI